MVATATVVIVVSLWVVARLAAAAWKSIVRPVQAPVTPTLTEIQ